MSVLQPGREPRDRKCDPLVVGGPNESRASTMAGCDSDIRAASNHATARLGRTPGSGVAFFASSLFETPEALARNALSKTINGALDMTDAFEETIKKATDGQKHLTESLSAFRGHIANDIRSISASGDRVREEIRKIDTAVQGALTRLNSPEMLTGLANAERLVTALQAIQDLKSTRLAFAVMGEQAESPSRDDIIEAGKIIKADHLRFTGGTE